MKINVGGAELSVIQALLPLFLQRAVNTALVRVDSAFDKARMKLLLEQHALIGRGAYHVHDLSSIRTMVILDNF